jgi:hypothetical protein
MPTRYLKPGIRDSDRIEAVLDPDAEILFYRLLIVVDDFGRTDARPLMVKSACFPIRMRVNADNCMQWLNILNSTRLIGLYEVDGKPYLQIAKWDNKPRANASKFPEPSADVYKRMQMLPVTVTVTVTKTGTETDLSNASRSSSPPAEKPPKADPIPYQKIIDLYHQTLPSNPKCLKLSTKRKAQIGARWRNGDIPDLETWKEYFEFVAASAWLTGKCEPSPGRTRFIADIEWLTNETNFTKTYERKYHGR